MHTQPPWWWTLDNDNCWFCKNRNNCGNCKLLKEQRAIERRKRKYGKYFSIKSGVDERLLQSSIGIFKSKHENMFVNPYIFINKRTFDDLYSLLNSNCDSSKRIQKDEKLGFSGYYQGYKMFEDNTLDYGEVELR